VRKWYEIDDQQRTLSEKKEAWRAYHVQFLASRRGREVLCDMKRRIGRAVGKSQVLGNAKFDPHLAIAQLYLDDFIAETLELCGVTNDMRLLEASRDIGQGYEPVPEKPFIAEDHAE
jgi:hypothetical protein